MVIMARYLDDPYSGSSTYTVMSVVGMTFGATGQQLGLLYE